jgi:hypothetical protein
MMFFTLGISCTPRCTACGEDLGRDVHRDVVDAGRRLGRGDQRLAQGRHLALGRVAELHVEGDVAAFDLHVLHGLGADEILARVRVRDARQCGEQLFLGGHVACLPCSGEVYRGRVTWVALPDPHWPPE